MQIQVNGRPEITGPSVTIEDMLAAKKLDSACVVVELNRNVIKKETFSSVVLKEHDVVEILRFVGGG